MEQFSTHQWIKNASMELSPTSHCFYDPIDCNRSEVSLTISVLYRITIHIYIYNSLIVCK